MVLAEDTARFSVFQYVAVVVLLIPALSAFNVATSDSFMVLAAVVAEIYGVGCVVNRVRWFKWRGKSVLIRPVSTVQEMKFSVLKDETSALLLSSVLNKVDLFV